MLDKFITLNLLIQKVLSDQYVSEGNTSRRVKYENGDIAEYGTHPKKESFGYYIKRGKIMLN